MGCRTLAEKCLGVTGGRLRIVGLRLSDPSRSSLLSRAFNMLAYYSEKIQHGPVKFSC
jgi:hypothetical protein